MKHPILTTLAIAALLSACTQLTSPPQTLEQKLSNAYHPDEQREVLRLACLNEAEYTTRLNKADHQRKYGAKRLSYVRDTEETRTLKSLCRKMNDASTDEQKIALAHECRKELEVRSANKPKYKRHYDAMQNICTKMTMKTLP